MALAHDLLAQAEQLANLDPGKPKQANLRRAISSAYYALFHLLAAECVRRVQPASPAGVGARIARTLAHTEMKEVCGNVIKSAPGPIFLELQPGGFSDAIRIVAEAFLELQNARHTADYDLAATYTRTHVAEFTKQAADAFEKWQSVRDSEEATVFIYALLFARRWAK